MQEMEDLKNILNGIGNNKSITPEIIELCNVCFPSKKTIYFNIFFLKKSLKPKICLRKCIVTQKSFKRKGKKSGISKFVKLQKVSKTGVTVTPKSVGFLVLTNRNLLLFEVII